MLRKYSDMSDDALVTLAANMNRLIGRGGVHSSNEAAQKASQGRVSRSTFDRLRNIDKAGSVSVGIDKLDGVAKTFGVEVWQLFTQNLDVRKPPRLANESNAQSTLAFEYVDIDKLSRLDKDQLAKLEGAILLTAAQLGLDVKKQDGG